MESNENLTQNLDETIATASEDTIKLKENLSRANSEASKYKKALSQRDSELTQKQSEYDELKEQYTTLETRIKNFELKEQCLDAGFSKDETAKLIESGMSPSVIAQIIKSRLNDYISSQNASKIANNTPKISMNTKASATEKNIGTILAEQKYGKK